MSRRSFVDFGRCQTWGDVVEQIDRECDDHLHASLERESERLIAEAFACPPDPTDPTPPLTAAMIREVYEELRRSPRPPIVIQTPRREEGHLADAMRYSMPWGFRFGEIQPTFGDCFGISECALGRDAPEGEAARMEAMIRHSDMIAALRRGCADNDLFDPESLDPLEVVEAELERLAPAAEEVEERPKQTFEEWQESCTALLAECEANHE
jgi:hypothetical protein